MDWNVILEYVAIYAPVVFAILSEALMATKVFSTLKKAKETEEFKAVAAQHKILIQELRESKRLNKELLTKIDRIQRGESDEPKNS